MLDIYPVEDCGCNGPQLILKEGQENLIFQHLMINL